MTQKLLFLSHIHEEKDLALSLKQALEDEFSGFIDVFVSSDGMSIPAGANFLKRIEDSLTTCVGAIYLIGPTSVKRHWVSFELGAVWVRNVLNTREGSSEIPTLPMCHSGMTPGALPAPLNNLNAVLANQASQLEFAFRSLQAAVGGNGKLRTDFDALSARVAALELEYTLGRNVATVVRLATRDVRRLIDHCESLPPGARTTIRCGFVETAVVQTLRALETGELLGRISVEVTNPGTTFGPGGAVNGADVSIELPVALVVQFKDQVLA